LDGPPGPVSGPHWIIPNGASGPGKVSTGPTNEPPTPVPIIGSTWAAGSVTGAGPSAARATAPAEPAPNSRPAPSNDTASLRMVPAGFPGMSLKVRTP
jgi:hypothetical protein